MNNHSPIVKLLILAKTNGIQSVQAQIDSQIICWDSKIVLPDIAYKGSNNMLLELLFAILHAAMRYSEQFGLIFIGGRWESHLPWLNQPKLVHKNFEDVNDDVPNGAKVAYGF